MFVPPTRARAVNRRTTGCVVDRAIAMFADAVVESFCVMALELEVVGAGMPCGLVVPSASCSFSFLSFRQSLTLCPRMSQCVQYFLPFSFSFSLLSLVFLEAFAKKVVAPAPNSRILRCSSFKICALTSAGMGSTIELASMVFSVPREFGSAEIIAVTTMSSPIFKPKFQTTRTDHRREFIWGSSGSESVKVILKISSRCCIFLWIPLPS